MPQRLDDDLYAPAPEVLHYNVRYVGGIVHSRLRARNLAGQKLSDIEWIWIIEAKRYATNEEIKQLCTGRPA